MRFTRSKMEEVTKLINTTLESFKADFLKSITELIKSEVESFLAKKTSEYEESVKIIKQHVSQLQSKQSSFDIKFEMLEKRIDDLEQYTRRPNLRIFGVPVSENESPRDVKSKVIDIITKNKIEIDPNSLDRAHRIGKEKQVSVVNQDAAGNDILTNITTQPIIARFGSFYARTQVYRKRMDIKKSLKYGISFDLTKARYALLQEAKESVKSIDGIDFVYVDVNRNLRAFTANGKHRKFDSMADLACIVNDL